MANTSLATMTSPFMMWCGRVLSGLVVLFLLFDGTIKVLEMDIATQTTAQLGYPVSVVFGLGILTLIIAVLYAIPRTSARLLLPWADSELPESEHTVKGDHS